MMKEFLSITLLSVLLFGCVQSNQTAGKKTFAPKRPTDPTLVEINNAFREYFTTKGENTDFRNRQLLKSWDRFIGQKVKAQCKVKEVREGGSVSLIATRMGVDADEVMARYDRPWDYPAGTFLMQAWDVNFYINPTNFDEIASSLRKGQVVYVEGTIKKLENKSTRGGYIGKGSRSEMLVPSTDYFTIDFSDSLISF